MKYFFILFILSGCSAGWHLKQAKRNIRKAELKGATWSADTVLKEVTVFVPSVRYDTLFKSEPGDTVTILKDRLQIKYVRLPGDTVWIDGECEADTIIQKVPTYINNEIKADKSGIKWWWLLVAAVVGFFLCWFKK